MSRLRPAAVAAAIALAAAPARAAEEAGAPPALSITVRGGVSLGAHEAGVAYYALRALRGGPFASARIVTGASAGSLNGLLTVIEACGGSPAEPERSLFWSTWIPVGFDQLFVPGAAGPVGVFSRDWLLRGAARIEEAWSAGLPEACDVVLGIATTRLQPRPVPLAGGQLALPTMEEKFAIRIQGRGPGRPPRATNYAGRGAVAERLLVTDAEGEIAFPSLRDLVFASMSFPVAFPPQPLPTCDARRAPVADRCPAADAAIARFVDGGIFDNAPIRFAVRIARAGLEPGPGGALGWRPVPDGRRREVPANVVFGFLDPEATEYPPARPAAPGGEPSITAQLEGLADGFVATARAKELARLVEEEPEVAERIMLPRRNFPAASAPVYAFLGFFETEFRVFDFTLGMYDARRMIEVHGEQARPAFPEAAGGPGWTRLACMRAVYDGLPGGAEACRGEALGDFRALLQLSLDQLYDLCRAAAPAAGELPWRNPHCARAARGEPPPRVPGLAPARWPDFRQAEGETELAWSMRLLGSYGFRFTDLRVPKGRGDLAVDRIRDALGDAGEVLAAAQPQADRHVVGLAARVAADTLSYAPYARVLHLTMGPTETELGWSRTYPGSTWFPRSLRFDGAVAVRGLGTLLSAGHAEPFGALAVGGLEWQPPLRSILARARFGLRAGWLFAKEDDYGAGTCADRGRAAVSACSRPVVQALLSTSLLDRFRVQLVGEWYPPTPTRSKAWSIAPGIGLELGL